MSDWPPPEPTPAPCPARCGFEYLHTWRPGPPDGPRWKRGRWMRPDATPLCEDCTIEALRPKAWPPAEPAPWMCNHVGCGVLLSFTWEDGPWHGPADTQGRWAHPEIACPPHTAEAIAVEKARRLRSRMADAGLPKRLQCYSFDRFAEIRNASGGSVSVSARSAVTSEEFTAFQGALPDGMLGITPWNRGLAKNLRRMCRRGGVTRTVLISGPVGTGKSTLAAATVAGLVAAGVDVFYIAEAELLEQIRMEAADRSRKGRGIVDRLSRVSVLVLDDLGTVESPKGWHLDAIEHLISARYDNDLPMLITTNAEFSDLADIYGERVASRLVEMTGRVQRVLSGPDWRTGEIRESVDIDDADTDGDGVDAPETCPGCGYNPCRGGSSCGD